ncbi:MAG: flippase [Roseburia sp.]|nr:flippase [Roseburia sp.]
MKSVKNNVVYNTIFQILTLAIPLLSTPYIARVLGAESVGKYSFSLSMTTYFTIFAVMGSSVYGQRLIAFSRDDKPSLNSNFWNIFSFRLISCCIALGFYFLYLFLTNNLTLLNVIVSLNILNVAVDVTWFFSGLEEFKITIVRGMLVKIVGYACIFIFVRNCSDTWKYALILLGTTVLGNLALCRVLPNYVNRPKKVEPFINIKGMFLVFLPTIATQVYMVLDKTMIGLITNSDYFNGCYEQSEKVVRAILIPLTAVSSVVLPRVANLYKRNALEQAKQYIYKAYRVIWALALPCMFGLIAIASVFIPLYLGPNYEMSIDLLKIFAILAFVVAPASITGLAYLVPTNQQNVYTIAVTSAAIVNFGLNILLIRNYGAYGAAIASVIAESIGTCIQITYCVITKQLVLKDIFKYFNRYLFFSIIMFCVIIFIKQNIAVSIYSLVLLIGTGGLCYILLLLVTRDELVMSVISSVKKIVLHKA